VTSIRVIHGDCLDPVTGLASLEDGSVDVTISDPPFEAEAHTKQRRVKRSGGIMELEPLEFPPITEEQRDAVAAEIARVTRRWALVFCQVEAAHKWIASLVAAGHVYRRTCIWDKPDGMPQYSGDRPGMGYETIVVTHAPGKSRWNGGGRTGVFRFNKNESPRTGHATQKPLKLMRELVRLFSDPGELILDPFAGSGSTGAAAAREGRRFLGWEKSAEWAELADKRARGEAWARGPQADLFAGAGRMR
jgi:site-specific DNA-methyltransferase (adenine-specific)